MSKAAIKQLLKTNQIWQASEKKRSRPALSSGYPALDKQLHYAGWPQGAVSELLLPANGTGELRLLAPLMANLSQQSGYICWINPPFEPYAPALSGLGIDISKLIIIKTCSDIDTIWTAQQAMNSKACSLVLTWLPKKNLSKELRKLCLAAENSQCWGVTLRHQSLATTASPAALRMILHARQTTQGLFNQPLSQVSIIKQPGGWSGQEVKLNLYPESIYWTSQAAKFWPSLATHSKSSATFNPEQAQAQLKQSHLMASLERSVRQGSSQDRCVNGDLKNKRDSHQTNHHPLH